MVEGIHGLDYHALLAKKDVSAPRSSLKDRLPLHERISVEAILRCHYQILRLQKLLH